MRLMSHTYQIREIDITDVRETCIREKDIDPIFPVQVNQALEAEEADAIQVLETVVIEAEQEAGHGKEAPKETDEKFRDLTEVRGQVNLKREGSIWLKRSPRVKFVKCRKRNE